MSMFFKAAAALLVMAGPALATDHSNHKAHAGHGSGAAHGAPAATGDATTDISAKLKAMFETEGHPLAVNPVVVAGDWAIAGWAQDGRGGRALLKKKGDAWSIHLCSGDSLKDAAALKQIGLPAADADGLAVKLAEAEKGLDPALLAMFASFEGTVMVEGADDGHAHGHQHKP